MALRPPADPADDRAPAAPVVCAQTEQSWSRGSGRRGDQWSLRSNDSPSSAIIVTGGASGIGEACVQRLAAEGGRILLVDINEQGARDVADKATAAGGEVLVCVADICWEDGVAAMVAAAGGRRLRTGGRRGRQRGGHRGRPVAGPHRRRVAADLRLQRDRGVAVGLPGRARHARPRG